MPSATTLAAKTSQIAAWYRYAVYVEGELAKEKAKGAGDLATNNGFILEKLNAIETYLSVSVKIAFKIISSVQLTWIDNSSDETHFVIERSPGVLTQFVELKRVGSNVTTYLDAALAPGTYLYRVRAFNSQTNQFSNYSPIIVVSIIPN